MSDPGEGGLDREAGFEDFAEREHLVVHVLSRSCAFFAPFPDRELVGDEPDVGAGLGEPGERLSALAGQD